MWSSHIPWITERSGPWRSWKRSSVKKLKYLTFIFGKNLLRGGILRYAMENIYRQRLLHVNRHTQLFKYDCRTHTVAPNDIWSSTYLGLGDIKGGGPFGLSPLPKGGPPGGGLLGNMPRPKKKKSISDMWKLKNRHQMYRSLATNKP